MSTSDSELENSVSFQLLSMLLFTPAVVTNVLFTEITQDGGRCLSLSWYLFTGANPGDCSRYYNIVTFTGQPKQELLALRTGVTVDAVVTNIVPSCRHDRGTDAFGALFCLEHLLRISTPSVWPKPRSKLLADERERESTWFTGEEKRTQSGVRFSFGFYLFLPRIFCASEYPAHRIFIYCLCLS